MSGAGCNLVVGGDDYSVGARWGCVGSVASPAGEQGAPVAIALETVQFTNSSPFPGALIEACGIDDLGSPPAPPCSMPITMATTDSAGAATLTVASGFNGYFYVTAPGQMDSLVYLSSPVVAAGTYLVQVGPYADYVQQVTSVAGSVVATDGAILVHAEDCLGQPAEGVQLALEGAWAGIGALAPDPFYFVGGSPQPSSTQAQTTTEGEGGFADVLPLRGALTATLASNGELYASFSSALVREKTLTVVWLQPTAPP